MTSRTFPGAAVPVAVLVGALLGATGCGVAPSRTPDEVSVEPAVVTAAVSATTAPRSTLGLAEGFPVELVPVLPGATVTASTVASRGDRFEVSLSGTTPKTRAAVLAFYGAVFDEAGYTRPTDDGIGPGTVTQVWARGDDVVVVAVDDSTPRSFSVGGTVSR